MTPREVDLAAVRTVPIARRPNKVRAEEFASPPPGGKRTFAAFLASLPDVLVARDFVRVIDAIAQAKQRDRAVVVMLGGHVVKTGLAPLLIDLMRRGIITHLAMNGSAAIHDYEIARFGGTSEDVAAGLRDGTFGMAEETGRGLNDAFTAGMREKLGMGESIAVALESIAELAHPELSVILGAHRLGLPVTVHAALGAEIIHQHPAANGAAIGDTSHRDFRRLAASLPFLHDGGVVLNLGSAVIMGHSMSDAVSGTYRTKEELEEYLKRDPIIVLRTQLQQAGQLTDDEFAKLDEELKAVVQDSWDFAEQSPEPPIEALYEDVLVDTTSDAHAEAAVAAD